MSFAGWLMVSIVVILILIIAIGIGWWVRNHRKPITPPNEYTSPLGWGETSDGPDSDKNYCQTYEFPTSIVNLSGIDIVVPGNPTFNSEILNNLQGTGSIPVCLDADQILAKQQQHTCISPEGVTNDNITRCLLINGGTTGLGGTEVFYSNNGCEGTNVCPGEISLISINFQAPTISPIYCIQNEGETNQVSMQICNPSLPAQLFRVTRINVGQNPSSLQPSQGQNGLIAQILDRNTGLCLVPGTATTTTTYNPVSVGCTDAPQQITGGDVVMAACTGGAYPGYIWALLPSLEYCSTTTGCTAGNISYTPQQIVYTGNLDLNNAPLGTGYNGFTGSSALIQWLIDNNAQSLYFGGTGNSLILNNLSLNFNSCPDKPATSQYINLPSYNTISQQYACIENNTPTNSSCVSF